MIIYGTRATPLKSLQLLNEVCSNCNTKGSIVLGVYSKFAHIFWVPTFPVGRIGISTCAHCRQTLVKKDMPSFLKLQYEQVEAQTKVPFWTWTGLALIAVVIGMSVLSANAAKKRENVYINAPAVGDFYRFKTDDGAFSMMKVVAVRTDSIVVQYNDYQTDKKSGIDQLKEKPFGDAMYLLSKGEIVDMYKSGTIYAVDR